jgi:hypothetical protein
MLYHVASRVGGEKPSHGVTEAEFLAQYYWDGKSILEI